MLVRWSYSRLPPFRNPSTPSLPDPKTRHFTATGFVVRVEVFGRAPGVLGFHLFNHELQNGLGQCLGVHDGDALGVEVGASWVQIEGAHHEDLPVDDHGFGMDPKDGKFLTVLNLSLIHL